jgi:hypothetical protein
VSRFNFDIHPSAILRCGRKSTRSTRDLLKTTAAKRRWRAIAPGRASGVLNSVGRATQQQAAHANQQLGMPEVVRDHCETHGKQLTYRNFKISTARFGQLTWIAYFARSDGHPVLWDGMARSVVETGSYSSEMLAIADAELSIDDLMGSAFPTLDNVDQATDLRD